MASTQPGAIVNLVLFFSLGCGGWFIAASRKVPREEGRPVQATVAVTGSAHQPGVFAADAIRIFNSSESRGSEFELLTSRYGSGSPELAMLAAPVLEKWVAADPAGAASEGVTRCLAHTPDLLPRVFSWLGAAGTIPAEKLLEAVPSGPLRRDCISAFAAARGTAGRETGIGAPDLNRHERSLILREWHRTRAAADAPAAESSAGALTDPDDREAALAGIAMARAAADPGLALRASITRHDFTSIAMVAFSAWIPRDASAAWAFAATLKGDSRLPAIAAHMLSVENRRRRFAEALPELASLLNRLFPGGMSETVLSEFIPALARENTAAAQRFTDSLTGPDRDRAAVILFDALCALDPAAAWRLATAEAQKPGAKDNRSSHSWQSATPRMQATPEQRLASGFPDLSDMAQLAHAWLDVYPAAAITTFLEPSVPAPLQRLVVETAINPNACAIPAEQLLLWARKGQPDHIMLTIEALVDIKPEEKRDK